MKGVEKRKDDFEAKREHLKNLSDAELKAKFWELAEQLVDPLLDIAYKHTSPSIERSVLLRMGFSSIEAQALVENVMDRGLLNHGAGHVVYKVSTDKGMDVRQAGLELIDGKHWDDVLKSFGK